MGLHCDFNLHSSGFWPSTKNGHFPVDYSSGNAIFESTFNSIIDARCPVKTGNLKNSCHSISSGMNTQAGTNCDYAEYVEYGSWKTPPRYFFTMATIVAYLSAFPAWVESYEDALEQEFDFVYDDVYQQCFAHNPKQNETFADNWARNAATVSVNSQRTYRCIIPTVRT